MRRFVLIRKEDVSGVSGTGEVAEGVEFHDGKVALCWFGPYHSVEIIENLPTVDKIHGHDGKTYIDWRN